MPLRLSDFELDALLEKNGKPKKKRASRKSKLESDLLAQLERAGLKGWRSEYRFHSVRDWRFDFAHPDLQIAVECEGLTRDGQGRHQNIKGMTEDCRKYAEATLWGWTVLRFTHPMIKSGEAIDTIQRLINRRSHEQSHEIAEN